MAPKNKKEKAQADEEYEELLHVRRVIIDRLSRFEQFLFSNTNNSQVFQIEIRLKSIEDDFHEFDRV